MKLILALLLSLLALAQGRFLGSRIINGRDAKLGERPFQVSLQMFEFHFCGGSIINENYIVTAAHCLMTIDVSEIQIIVGAVNLVNASLVHKAEKLISHESFVPHKTTNDIALIKVTTPIKFSEYVKPVTLPEPHWKVKTNSTAIVSGWGFSGSSYPDVLQVANIFIADQEYCRKIMQKAGQNIVESNICANDPTMNRGQCNGDSGGPLTIDEKLVGIVSWSIKDPGCGSTKYPGVYTRVSEFIDWIRQNVR